MSKTILGIVVSIGAVVLLSGCGASGQQFSQFTAPKPDRAQVYVYRPESFVGGGVYYDVHITNSMNPDRIIGELVNGSYIEFDVPSGESEVWGKTEAKSSITLDVKTGETYCVKGGVGIGFLVGRPNLEIVDMATCKNEIAGTRLAK